MTDPITSPAQMREAFEQAVLAEKMRMMSWCAKRNAISRKAWERAARKALAGDMAELRTRIALIDAGPLDIEPSGADETALPVAEPEPQAVKVKPLQWKDDAAEVRGLGLRYILCDPESADEGNGWYVLEETTNKVIEGDGSRPSAIASRYLMLCAIFH